MGGAVGVEHAFCGVKRWYTMVRFLLHSKRSQRVRGDEDLHVVLDSTGLPDGLVAKLIQWHDERPAEAERMV